MQQIVCRLAKVARSRGIKNSNRLREALANRISQPTLKKLWDNRARTVRLNDMILLCETLDCEVEDLFKRTEAGESPTAATATENEIRR